MKVRVCAEAVFFAVACGIAGLGGCAPPDVAGTYDVDLVALEETCPDVDQGDELNDIVLTVTQNDDVVQATATIFFIFDYNFIGSTDRAGFEADSTDSFEVDVDGAGGNCMMTYSFTIDASVDESVIGGEMLQFGVSNGDPSCLVDTCTVNWDLIGVRRP